jgi:hypothetical protein
MMKKLLTVALLASAALSASAEFRWGPMAGVYLGNYHWRQPLVESKMQPGFQAGLLGEIMIPGIGFGIDLGVNYSMHASKISLGDQYIWSSDGYGDVDFKMHNIEVPVHLRFKWTRMEGFEQYLAPFAYVGPVFQFHVKQSDCKAIEHPLGSVSIQFGIGAEILRNIQLSGSYMWTPTYSIRTVKLDNFSASNSGWTVNLAYLF